MGRFLVRFFRGEWSRRVEECELAKEGVETSLLVSPVDLSLSVTIRDVVGGAHLGPEAEKEMR